MGAIHQAILMAALSGPTEHVSIDSPDPYFSSVKALFHFNGTDESTTITDVCGNTVTRAGNTQLKTAEKAFGSASVYFDGVGDQFYIAPGTNALDIYNGSSDSTVEFWYRAASNAGNQCLVEFAYNSSNRANISLVSGSLVFYTQTGAGSGIRITASSTPAAGTWVYVSLVRSASTFTLYINGKAVGTSTTTGLPSHATNMVMCVGRSHMTSANDYTGYIDELRVTKGVARYTYDLLPPLGEFSDT